MSGFVGFRGSVCNIFGGSVLMTLVLSLGACTQDNSSSVQASAQNITPQEQDWVKEELLTQLTALRKELAELRKEVKTLDGKVSNLKVAGIKPSRPATVAPKEMALKDPYAMGDDAAKVIVLEFTDYQCPYCARHSKNVLPSIKRNFVDTGKIRYAVRDYPLGFHAQAKGAAIAANCAGEQGKYWEMHEILFNNSRSLSEEFYKQQVVSLGMSDEKFQACIGDDANSKSIDQVLAEGAKYGVTGTPKFFVGVIKEDKVVDIKVISGAQGYNVFASAIEARL